ncbi:hypothetical protein VNO77_44198 [Canavalia gladiata]|uniref:Uncharacterized protein n=1 Tax=Canavalia gladiata TaxID=3824 RepID=A0AAN9PQJ3_CANGL
MGLIHVTKQKTNFSPLWMLVVALGWPLLKASQRRGHNLAFYQFCLALPVALPPPVKVRAFWSHVKTSIFLSIDAHGHCMDVDHGLHA